MNVLIEPEIAPALRPCPACAGPVEYIEIGVSGEQYVECSLCKIAAWYHVDFSPAQVAHAWNEYTSGAVRFERVEVTK